MVLQVYCGFKLKLRAGAKCLLPVFALFFMCMGYGPLELGSSGVAQAQTVSSIRVEGNTRIDRETIISYLTIQRGSRASASSIDESIRELFATGLFEDVSMRVSGGTLIVAVKENPIINTVNFEGNKTLKDNALQQVVTSKVRSSLTRSAVETDVQRILESYRRFGRFDAVVEVKVVDQPQNRVDLIFEIFEGGKTTISDIAFIGNESFGEGRLRSLIRLKETGFLGFIRTTNIYDPDRLASSRDALRQFYLDNGFADFQIVSAVADLDRDRNQFFVTFTLDEGERYRFGDIEVESSISELDPEALRRMLSTKSGKIYNASLVDQSIQDVTIALAEAGYAFAQVRPRGERDPDSNTISVTYLVDEGPRVFIERINIIGNERTRDYVIRREFDFAEGDAFNRALIDRAEKRLRNLDYFDSIDITTEQGSEPDRVVLNVRLVEKGTGSLSVGAGYSTADGIIADISLSERNFLGRGQYVSASVSGGVSSRNFTFSFTEPYFLGRRISAGFDVFNTSNEGDDDTQNYDFDSSGGGIRFGFPITEAITIRTGYNLKAEEISNAPTTASAAILQAQAQGQQITSSVSVDFIYNTIDNMTNPSHGEYFSLRQEVAGLGGDTAYYKAEADARIYRELYPAWDLVGFLRARGGAIEGYNGKSVQLLDSYFIGGSTVRGFESSGIGPYDANSGDRLGAKYYVGGTAELQMPMPFIPDEFGLKIAGFVDVGTAFGTDFSNVDNNGDGDFIDAATDTTSADILVQDFAGIRSSVGAGVLWASPFGLLRIDAAYVIDSQTGDEQQTIRFGTGRQF